VGLPYAFFHAGAWLATACMVVSTLMASATMGYLVEASAWCGYYHIHHLNKAPTASRVLASGETGDRTGGGEEEGGWRWEDEGGGEGGEEEGGEKAKQRAGWEQVDLDYEISEVCGLFLGLPARRLLEISLFCYIMGSCWLYASIFASSLLLVIPLPLPNQVRQNF